MNGLSARLVLAWHRLTDRMADVWKHRHDQRGFTTAEMALLAVGLVIVAGVLVTAIIAFVKSQSAELKKHG